MYSSPHGMVNFDDNLIRRAEGKGAVPWARLAVITGHTRTPTTSYSPDPLGSESKTNIPKPLAGPTDSTPLSS